MSVSEILVKVEAAGIAIRLDGERIRIWFPSFWQREKLAGQVAFLRAHRGEVAEFLRRRDGDDSARARYFWGTCRDDMPSDYYGWRAHVALEAMSRIPAPAGLIVWLDKHSPYLYHKLTSSLPDQISRAWDARIPFEGFDELCFELMDTYRRAAELYRTL